MNTEFEVLTDTLRHSSEVAENLEEMASLLRRRGIAHDRSKLTAFEFDAFVSTRPKFKLANWNTPEYKECTDAIRPAINAHYAANSHHVEHYANGVNDMTLMDICEMLADWQAAGRRSPNGKSLPETLDAAFEKYGIDSQLGAIIKNTISILGWR